MPVRLVGVTAEGKDTVYDPIVGRVLVVCWEKLHATAIVASPLVRENLLFAHSA